MDWLKIAFFTSVLFLLTLGSLAYGVAIGIYKLFPYELLREIKNELDYLPADFFGGYDRFLVEYRRDVTDGFSPIDVTDGFSPIKAASGAFPGAVPRIRRTGDSPLGYRVIVGTFDFEGPRHAALLLSPDDVLINIWSLDENYVDDDEADPRPQGNKFPHGFQILRDGSVVFAFDGGVSLQRRDWCGALMWLTLGDFHHSITKIEGEAAAWTLLSEERKLDIWGPGGEFLAKVDLEDGSLMKKISFQEIIDANPGFSLLNILQQPADEGSGWMGDPLHPNDVDPLPESLEAVFPQFSTGDLLVSLRSLNALLVVDPETLQVKWWRAGAFMRQHDPDWLADGTISIYDNNMYRPPSRIVSMDPKTFGVRVLFDGAAQGVHTKIRGKHERLPGGNILMTVPDQGRVIEVNAEGEIVFEFSNVFDPTKNEYLLVSEAMWLPEDFFVSDLPACPQRGQPGVAYQPSIKVRMGGIEARAAPAQAHPVQIDEA